MNPIIIIWLISLAVFFIFVINIFIQSTKKVSKVKKIKTGRWSSNEIKVLLYLLYFFEEDKAEEHVITNLSQLFQRSEAAIKTKIARLNYVAYSKGASKLDREITLETISLSREKWDVAFDKAVFEIMQNETI